jgi:hypothetical protein
MAVILTIFYILVIIASQPSFPLDRLQNKFAVIISIFQSHISLLTLYTGSIITRVHYSALSTTLPLALLRTLPPYPSGLGRTRCLLYLATPALRESFPLHIPIYLGRTVSVHIHTQGYMVIRRNGVFRSGGMQAHITYEYGTVRVCIQLQKQLDVKAGQSINLWMWMPSVSFWSFLQSHPFVVIS